MAQSAQLRSVSSSAVPAQSPLKRQQGRSASSQAFAVAGVDTSNEVLASRASKQAVVSTRSGHGSSRMRAGAALRKHVTAPSRTSSPSSRRTSQSSLRTSHSLLSASQALSHSPSQVSPHSSPQKTEQSRPQMRVIEGGKHAHLLSVEGAQRAWLWMRSRSAPIFYVVISVVFLFSSLVGSLALRTQMAQNSFQSSEVQVSIAQLRQDVADAQAQLDTLQAQLPQKAQEMGMIPQESSVTVDLQGYQATN